MNEPTIIINGTQLTPGQAMAVRVAVTDYFSQMSDPDALGNDEHGRRMTAAYFGRLEEVVKLMLPTGFRKE